MTLSMSNGRVHRRVLASVAAVVALGFAISTPASAFAPADVNRVLGRARNSDTPNYLALSPNGKTAYVTTNSDTLDAIDVATMKRTGAFALGHDLMGVAISKDGKKAYVGSDYDGDIRVAALPSGKKVKTITGCDGPAGNAVSPNGKLLYQACWSGDSVSIVDTATNTMTGEILVGLNPSFVAFAPDGKTAYVSNTKSGTISVVNTKKAKEIATIPVGKEPHNLIVSPNGARLYVSCDASDELWVIDIATKQVLAKLPFSAGPEGIAVSPDSLHVYVGTNGIGVIDSATNTLVGTIPVQGKKVWELALTPDGTKAVALVGNYTYFVDVSNYTGQ